jgi:hypothetical protein
MIKYIIHKYQITRIRYKFARAGLYLKECKYNLVEESLKESKT